MKTLYKAATLCSLLLVLFAAQPSQRTIARQDILSATPTYDPLVEPPLPPDPTEYEVGRNLYWHWCMTCHGDRGQGLTDEFRGIWEPEHQNCWGRGCHAGRPGDEGFPIPTVVPELVNENQLERFTSLQELSDFLKATHPPQSPGVLKDDEYHAIALFVFTMNGRSLVSIPITDTPALTPTWTLIPSQKPASGPFSIMIMISLAVLAAIGVGLVIRTVRTQK
jgi:mono/diheme cytochrome c family protein